MGDFIGKQKKELYSYVDSSKESIYFGSYPQTEIKDETLIMELNKKAGTLPTESNTYNWVDYGYYINEEVESYMYHIDIELDEGKYRGVYFTQYRPYYTTTTNSNTYQDDNGYNTNTIYWFKYEKIKWNILKTENGKALIVSDMLLDSQDYYTRQPRDRSGATDYQGISTTDIVYSNNYMYSHIRSWLNEIFYKTAFSTLEKEIIETTEVDNSVSSTGYSSNKYVCSNTSDKMFLLSWKEAEAYYSSNSERQAKGTDYAKSQGFYIVSGDSYYWLRSPSYYFDDCSRNVGYDGDIDSVNIYDYVSSTCYGVRPVCWVNL